MLNRSPSLATSSHSLPKINHWTDFERIAPIDSRSSSEAVGYERRWFSCNDHFHLDTKDFVDKLFDVIRSRRYIPEGKKVRTSREREFYSIGPHQENVQPTTSDLELEPTDALETPIASTVTRRDEGPSTESTAIPTVTSAVTVIQSVKR